MNDSSIQAKRRNAAFDRLEGLWLTNCKKLSSWLIRTASLLVNIDKSAASGYSNRSLV
jgi:hypothetical protein